MAGFLFLWVLKVHTYWSALCGYPVNVFSGYPSLSYFPIAVIKHHDQGSLWKKACSVRKLDSIAPWRNGQEFLFCSTSRSREREGTQWEWLWNLTAQCLPVTDLLWQGHIPNPSQTTVLPKLVSLWGLSSFKPPQPSPWRQNGSSPLAGTALPAMMVYTCQAST